MAIDPVNHDALVLMIGGLRTAITKTRQRTLDELTELRREIELLVHHVHTMPVQAELHRWDDFDLGPAGSVTGHSAPQADFVPPDDLPF